MDRNSWLAQRRDAVVDAYDSLAPSYDDDPYPTREQEQWVSRMLALVPA